MLSCKEEKCFKKESVVNCIKYNCIKSRKLRDGKHPLNLVAWRLLLGDFAKAVPGYWRLAEVTCRLQWAEE